jgi:hypothetical protein
MLNNRLGWFPYLVAIRLVFGCGTTAGDTTSLIVLLFRSRRLTIPIISSDIILRTLINLSLRLYGYVMNTIFNYFLIIFTHRKNTFFFRSAKLRLILQLDWSSDLNWTIKYILLSNLFHKSHKSNYCWQNKESWELLKHFSPITKN